jgi:hypothetical protein
MTSTSRNNSLVHEVHDNFDFEPKVFDIETTNQASSIKKNGSINHNHTSINSPSNSLNVKRNGIDNKYTHTKNSPSTSGPSYFNSNFDENGYVFDGIKIDV